MSNEIRVFNPEDVQNNKGIAALSIVPLLFLIYVLGSNKSEYLKYCSNQGIVFTILYIACNVIVRMLGFIPLIGWLISFVFAIVNIAVFILLIYQIYCAYNGRIKPLPVIGDIEFIK